MIDALIVTLREGVEAALVVGITLAYLTKVGRNDLRKVVYWALGAAFAGSIGAAIVLQRTNYNQDIFEGWIMLVAAFFVISMVWFMAKAARGLKGKIEQKVGALAGNGRKVGLFLFVFLMVLREGAETVLILAAVNFNTTELMGFLGTLLGVLLAVAFGVMFVKGSVRINLQKFFRITTVILIFVAAQLVISGLHELSENGVLPSSQREMALIGPIVRNDFFFFVTVLALAGLMILFEQRRRAPQADAILSAAERRKAAWSARRERLWMASVYSFAFIFILMVTAQFIYARSAAASPPATVVNFTNGSATLDATDVAEGDLHFYAADVQGTRVRFFLYRKPGGAIAAVADACQICGSQGFQRAPASAGGGVICKNCAAPINPQSVGRAGGCNPIPLNATVNGTQVTVTEAELAALLPAFRK
jgi:high-affinity iron transporter